MENSAPLDGGALLRRASPQCPPSNLAAGLGKGPHQGRAVVGAITWPSQCQRVSHPAGLACRGATSAGQSPWAPARPHRGGRVPTGVCPGEGGLRLVSRTVGQRPGQVEAADPLPLPSQLELASKIHLPNPSCVPQVWASGSPKGPSKTFPAPPASPSLGRGS